MPDERASWSPLQLTVSVVVPTRNGARRVPRLLQALAAQHRAPSFETIVVEDGSTCLEPDRAVTANGVRFLRQPHRGPAAARNTGAAASTGQILVFVDDDCQPHPEWLREMILPFADPEVTAVKGAYATSQRSLVARFVQCEYEEKFERLSRKPFIDFVDGYSAAFRRDVFEHAGGYDESYSTPSVEDRDLSLRLSQNGCRMVFNPAALVDHLHVETLLGYLAKKFKYGRWGVRILGRMPRQFVSDDHTPNSQRLQVIVLGLMPATAAAAWLLTPWLLAAWAAVFWGSSVNLVRRCWSAHWKIGLLAPVLVLLRASGLTGGLLFGACESMLGRRGRATPAHAQAAPAAVGAVVPAQPDQPASVAGAGNRAGTGRSAPALPQRPDSAGGSTGRRLNEEAAP